MVRGACANLDIIDRVIASRAANWKVDRLNRVDRTVLRIAIYEMLYRDDIPAPVSINEVRDQFNRQLEGIQRQTGQRPEPEQAIRFGLHVRALEETIQRASGALDVLNKARIVATLDEALEGLTHLCATAMTPRDFGPVAEVLGSQFLGHPPIEPYQVHITQPQHPLAIGIEPFTVTDELYVSVLTRAPDDRERQAVQAFRRLREINGHREFVFPGERDPKRPMSENAMLYALHRMGYKGRMTGHGFRAVASTILNECGYRADVIERQLAHSERDKVRAAYNRAEYLPERTKMLQAWADMLDVMRQGALGKTARHLRKVLA